MPAPRFLGKRLLFVTAHPDDESYAAAGTIVKNCDRGGKSFLVCATFGEQGKGHYGDQVSCAYLKRIRKAEMKEVCKFLKIGKTVMLNLPDTKLKECQAELKRKLQVSITALRPDYILSF